MITQATYSPEDNKIRLYADARLDDSARPAEALWRGHGDLYYAAWAA